MTIFISPDTSQQDNNHNKTTTRQQQDNNKTTTRQQQDEFQHYKIHRCYGVLRRVVLHPLSRDCLFIIWKDIGGGWQRFHRRKCRVGCSLEGVWIWIGEGLRDIQTWN